MTYNIFIEKIPGLYYLNEDGADIIWLLVGEKKALLVDTGFGRLDLKARAAEITPLPLTLVNTHIHPDHAGGNKQFDTVYVGEKDIPMIAEYQQHIPGFGSAKEVIPVQEGYCFDLGGVTVEVIDIAGHTPGSIGLLWRERKLMLSGDAVNFQVWMHLSNSSSLQVFKNSLQHLVDIQDKFTDLYSSHGQSGDHYTIETIQKLSEYAGAVITGEKKGEPATTHLGHDALLFMEDRIGFFYDPAKLGREQRPCSIF